MRKKSLPSLPNTSWTAHRLKLIYATRLPFRSYMLRSKESKERELPLKSVILTNHSHSQTIIAKDNVLMALFSRKLIDQSSKKSMALRIYLIFSSRQNR